MRNIFQHFPFNIYFPNRNVSHYYACNVYVVNPGVYHFKHINLKTEDAEKYQQAVKVICPSCLLWAKCRWPFLAKPWRCRDRLKIAWLKDMSGNVFVFFLFWTYVRTLSVAFNSGTIINQPKSVRGINFQFWNTPAVRSEAEYRILVVCDKYWIEHVGAFHFIIWFQINNIEA